MELMKLKEADIIEPPRSPAAFCGGINVLPSPLFSCKTRTQRSYWKTKTTAPKRYESACPATTAASFLRPTCWAILSTCWSLDRFVLCPTLLGVFDLTFRRRDWIREEVCEKCVNFTKSLETSQQRRWSATGLNSGVKCGRSSDPLRLKASPSVSQLCRVCIPLLAPNIRFHTLTRTEQPHTVYNAPLFFDFVEQGLQISKKGLCVIYARGVVI